jgi:hypothetical protein
MKLTPEQFILLENSFLRHFPTFIPDEIFQDYKSILEYKDLIRYAKPDKRILNRILDIAIEKIKSNQRFQKITFIKLIRGQCDNTFIDSTTSDKLFLVFKLLINEVNETIAWSLSTTIKDIELSQENINWLIDNYQISEHVQNRLLRYPKPNKSITTWSEQRLKKKDLDNRLSELIGLKLNFDNSFTFKDKTSLIWGVHYSKHLTADNLEEFIKICEKNNFTDILSQLYNDIDKSQYCDLNNRWRSTTV